MLRSAFLRSVSPVTFAAATEAGSAKTIDKVVYMSASQSLENVVARVETAADATLKMVAAIVVHMVIRSYHHDENERRKYNETKDEILKALDEFATRKRGQPFKHAWVARWISAATTFARSLVTDYDKKGVQDGSPLSQILRAKSADKGTDVVFDFIIQKTKGENSFKALEAAIYKKPAKAEGKADGRGKTKNAVRASTDKPERIGMALASDKGVDVINAMPGKAAAKAKKLSDNAMSSNVDHLLFVTNSLKYLSGEDLVAVIQACNDLIAEKAKEAKPGSRSRGKKTTTTPDEGEGGTPPAAVAAAE